MYNAFSCSRRCVRGEKVSYFGTEGSSSPVATLGAASTITACPPSLPKCVRCDGGGGTGVNGIEGVVLTVVALWSVALGGMILRQVDLG